MTAEEPRPAELARRHDDLSARMAAGFNEIGRRLDRVPTTDIMLAYLATRDQEMKANSEDIKDLAKALADERAERLQAVERERAAREVSLAEERLARKEAVEEIRTAREVDKAQANEDRKHARMFAIGMIGTLIAFAGTLVSSGVFG